MRWLSRRTLSIAGAVALVGVAIGFLSGPISADARRTPPAADGATATAAPARSPARPAPPRGRTFPGLDPLQHRVEDGVTVADLTDGSTAILSLDPGLQAHVAEVYSSYEVPWGALVALDPRSGRVLAYVSHSSADPNAGDLVLDPGPPTASVFKVVTGAALIDAGVQPDAPVCYHGGASRLMGHNLEDDPSRDRRCASLAEAMGGSINSVFGKLADRHLDAPTLQRYAHAFGFGHALPFDVPTRVSPTEVPGDRLELARTAAGFWHNYMSPLHGALVAATIANDGRMPRPTLVDQVIDGRGRESYRAEPEVFREVIPRTTARAVGRMMVETTRRGTARRYFFDPRGNAFLPGIEAAGKTGTLANDDPYRGYTWFVGYAPVDEPQIAVAALVINEPRWRIKGAYAAREAMRYWLVQRPRQQAAAARAASR
ncbi:MAG: penicillin-binding transpeptidase domain-containing protein [Myxococcota bacterium]|nr:penicillin-binding transpeptidase domain-containing protein [Myxococcota bacterium]